MTIKKTILLFLFTFIHTSKINGYIIKVGGARPTSVHVPRDFKADKSYPLVLFLHGYMSEGIFEEFYIDLKAHINERQFIFIRPEGNRNSKGFRFWNVNEHCCDHEKTGVDDLGYIDSIITEVKSKFIVEKVLVMGHSNGAHLAYRLACEKPDQIDGVISYAGSFFWIDQQCTLGHDLSVLHIHGTKDTVVPFKGKEHYPSATASIRYWANRYQCQGYSYEAQKYNSLYFSWNNQTSEYRWNHCRNDNKVILWTLEGQGHFNIFNRSFAKRILRLFGVGE